MDITYPKQFKLWQVPAVFSSIVVVGALTHCALLHSVCDLKAAQMNMQSSLIQELLLYKFKLSYNTVKAIKNNCYTKGESTFDHNTRTRWFKKFCLGDKNFSDQARSNRQKYL